MNKNKLELVWVGKEKRPRLEPRILIEDKALSYRADPPAVAQGELLGEGSTTPVPTYDNLLIHGDNLLALKALEAQYAGKVKCIFIDPPYNTGSAFTHYDDGVEHSMWLSLIRDRLEILRTLLSEDGSIWITIDDNEAHYLKVLCDEVFGRKNFIASAIWRKNYAPKSSAKHFSVDHDYVLIYAKNEDLWKPNPMPRKAGQDDIYRNQDNDIRGRWRPDNLSARNPYSLGVYSITTPGGRVIGGPPKGRYWAISKAKLAELDTDGRIWWGKDGNNVPSLKRFLSEVKQGRVPQTFWDYDEVGHTQDAKKEIVALFGDDVFGTPKPEKLMKRIIEIATFPGNLVLDSFGGSGTTGSVAQKTGRRWIMVELGEHCKTHIVPRLKKVIDGQDKGGVTEATGWQGGGGFRFLSLAPSMLKRDKWGNWIINPDYNPEMLAEAMCKHMGFIWAPSSEHFWLHGHSTENAFIYVTTGSLSHEQLRVISEEVGPDRSLLICCKAFMADAKVFANLTLKKIPKSVLGKCEWDHDDYSFSIDVLAPEEALEADDETEEDTVNENDDVINEP